MKSVVLAVLLAGELAAVELKPQTISAFDRHIREAEERLDSRRAFLWIDDSPEKVRQARQGAILVEPFARKAITEVPNGLVHDWVGTVFLPGVTLERTMALMRDYDHHKDWYKPEVIESRILFHESNDFKVYMRLLKKQVITVVLDTEHAVRYVPVDGKHWRSSSRSTRISEIERPGKPNERVLPPGTGQGFLWRLNSYWRFEERDGGTWVECEAISLTRDIPTGLNWLVQPIIRDLPKQSLENTLRSTRAALVK
jgi:hypothetical protein